MSSQMEESKRILVVDDEAEVLFILRAALMSLQGDVEISTARNGREALGKIEKTAFDLLITDINMPEINGIELTMEARSLMPDIQVVWITGYNNTGHLHEIGTQMGVYRCLDKPVKIGAIRETALKALEAGKR